MGPAAAACYISRPCIFINDGKYCQMEPGWLLSLAALQNVTILFYNCDEMRSHTPPSPVYWYQRDVSFDPTGHWEQSSGNRYDRRKVL